MAFIDTLIEKGIVTKSVAEKIEQESGDSAGDIERLLVERGVDPAELLELKSAYYNIPTRSLVDTNIPYKVLEHVPEESALHYKFVPLNIAEGTLEVGIVDPDSTGAQDAIQFIASKLDVPYKLYLISYKDFEEAAKQYKGLSGKVTKALSELETEMQSAGESELPPERELPDLSKDVSKTQIIEEAPVTKIVAVILQHAIEGGASDIHIEPLGDKIRVRFRVDGVMYTSLILPLHVLSAVVARVKILASLKLDERRKPQDGRFSTRLKGRKVDFRVSTLPTYYGEKVVMRILDPEKGIKTLEKLGMDKNQEAMVRDALAAPYGIILLTGPTGSGKTTTLYSMLSEVDRDTRNVISLEDPVEYSIAGVSQSQVRPEIGYTFANGLRSILRQDPDIIMVGEIRDKETAQLAIQAALTGHLVFSTLHTNNAAGVIPRLIDMDVDPFLIAPTLRLAIAQRLTRVACEGAKKMVPISESMQKMIEREVSDLPKEAQQEFLSAKEICEVEGTDDCPGGTRGRIGVFEMLPIERELEHIILENPTEQAVYEKARSGGMLTMKEDALRKTFRGVIPFEEVNRL